MVSPLQQLAEHVLRVNVVGATSGIGESTVKQFCRHTIKPRLYFIGRWVSPNLRTSSKEVRVLRINLTNWLFRSQDAGDRIISELKTIQPAAETTFIRKDLTLLKNVDEVCNEIKAKEKKLNLLFMSQGTMSLKGRDGKPPHPVSSTASQHHLLTRILRRNLRGPR